ncbi:hypothetical protein ACHAQA_009786 [Verticillium albo-atrum]
MHLHAKGAASLLYVGWAVAQSRYADNQLSLNQDDEIVARAFPELKDFDINAPAFLSPETVPNGFANATSGPTDDETLDRFVRAIAERNSWAHYHNPEWRSDEGRPLPYVYLSSSPSLNVTGQANSTQKVRIWVQGGQHGNEPAGDQAALALLGKLDANATWAASVLEKADILILPRYNPDGIAYFQRVLANGLDPNRDHTKLASQQTRHIKSLSLEFAPHVAVDTHEYTAATKYGANRQWVKAQDGQFSAAKNLNIHADIRGLAEGLFSRNIRSLLASRGLRSSPYYTVPTGTNNLELAEPSANGQVGHTSLGLGQAVAFLTETRGIRLGDQHWHRRVASGLTILEAIVQTVVDNADEVYDTIENARAEFIASNDDIIVTDTPRPTNVTWEWVDARNGSVIDVPVVFQNTTPLVPILTRSRPEAYVFPGAYEDVAARLRAKGVKVDVLENGFQGEVEALEVRTAELATFKFEGTAQTTVTTETVRRQLTLPPGGFYVSTRQKNAAYVFVSLEPEHTSSVAILSSGIPR